MAPCQNWTKWASDFEITTSQESTMLKYYKVAKKYQEFEAIQCNFRPISENDIFSTQNYKLAADLDRARKNTHFQKKRSLKRCPDEPVRSLWSCNLQDWAGTVAKKWDFYLIRAPKSKNNYTTEKFRFFYPKSKKNCSWFGIRTSKKFLLKVELQNKNANGEGSAGKSTTLNLTSKRPSHQL